MIDLADRARGLGTTLERLQATAGAGTLKVWTTAEDLLRFKDGAQKVGGLADRGSTEIGATAEDAVQSGLDALGWAQMKWSSVDPFPFKWPDGAVEHNDEGYESSLIIAGRPMWITIGFTTRHAQVTLTSGFRQDRNPLPH